jgi:hypothetical protein
MRKRRETPRYKVPRTPEPLCREAQSTKQPSPLPTPPPPLDDHHPPLCPPPHPPRPGTLPSQPIHHSDTPLHRATTDRPDDLSPHRIPHLPPPPSSPTGLGPTDPAHAGVNPYQGYTTTSMSLPPQSPSERSSVSTTHQRTRTDLPPRTPPPPSPPQVRKQTLALINQCIE